MNQFPRHPQEQERISALHRMRILNSLPEEEFDSIVKITSQICETPIAVISLVDESRQWFKAKIGIDAIDNPRELSFCSHTILQNDLLIVPDSTKDSRFAENPLVTGLTGYRFYAGATLLSPDGFPIGTLCVIDQKARDLTPEQEEALKSFAKQIQNLMALKSQVSDLKAINARLEFKRTALESINEGIVLHEATGKIVDYNSSALKILGLSSTEILADPNTGPQWHTFRADGSHFPTSTHPAQIALRTGKRQENVQMGLYRPDGSFRWLQINAVPLFLEQQGIPSHAVVSFADVTEQKLAQKEIEKKDNRVRQLLDGVPAMIGSWSKDLINLSANKAYLDYFGKTPEDIVGKSMAEILGPELFARNRPFVEKVLSGQMQTFERDLPFYDGTIHQTQATYLPEFENGQVVGFLVIVTDITDLKKIELQRREIEARLMESAQLSTLGEIAGGLAHEINNPLTIIQGTIGILQRLQNQDEPNSARINQLYQKMEQTVARTTQIINSLSQISKKLESVPLEMVAVSQVLTETLSLCQERLKFLDIAIHLKGPQDSVIFCRPSQITRLLLNLINNSVDGVSALSDRWIRIQCECLDNWLLLSVQDSGKALPPHVVKKLMQPFFTTKEIGKGTGLGLSMAKGIAEAHGGTLTYVEKDSHPCFVLRLPMGQ